MGFADFFKNLFGGGGEEAPVEATEETQEEVSEEAGTEATEEAAPAGETEEFQA